MNNKKCYVIVVGNEKGGAGKTTTSIHLIIFLLKLGFKVGSFDLDIRQKSLTRYLENRSKYKSIKYNKLLVPNHYLVSESAALNIKVKEEEEKNTFLDRYIEASNNNDFIVIDTPGSNSFLSSNAHSFADTVITPINDSFLDLDVLAQFDPENCNVIKPSIYSETIWKQKIMRAKRDQGEVNWVVLRNRLSNIDALNKRKVGEALTKLSNKVGFRVLEGFKERVIFRELFLFGLTLLDLNEDIFDIKMTFSHLAAKEELKSFLKDLNIDKIQQALEK